MRVRVEVSYRRWFWWAPVTAVRYVEDTVAAPVAASLMERQLRREHGGRFARVRWRIESV